MSGLIREIDEKLDQIKASQDAINSVIEINTRIINESINEIIYRLKMEAEIIESAGGDTSELGFNQSFVLKLPDHLRNTAQSLMSMGEGTAVDISKATKRSRSLESLYLNTLTNMGLVEKNRKGQTVHYRVKREKF
jgi:DNA-binding transcriptional ArsR family regulator